MDDLEHQLRESQLAAQRAAQRQAELEADAAAAALETAKQEAETAKAEAEAARTETEKAKAEAKKANQEADLESDPAVVAAKRQARLAELTSEEAASAAAARKAAVPEVPTIATIGAEADKSPKVDTDAGAAMAGLTAATALDVTGQEIGVAVAAALTESGSNEATVWLVDDIAVAVHEMERLALEKRLISFRDSFKEQVSGQQPAGKEQPEVGAQALPLEIAAFALSTGTSLAKFGVELAGALRGRYALYGRKTDLNRVALVAAALRALGHQAPRGVTVRLATFATLNGSPLLELFAEACRQRDIFEAKRLAGEAPTDSKALDSRAIARALVASFDAYATAVTTIGEGKTTSALVDAAVTERSLPRHQTNALLLQMDLTEQGADAILGYGLVHGTTAAFLGYVQAYYLLAKPDGTVLAAGTVTNNESATLMVKDADFRFVDKAAKRSLRLPFGR